MINDYNEVKECVYKDEHYSVRDNGAIFRHKREGKRLRLDDERWTFGFKNSKTGYMLLGDHRVHIIVATAFLGERDSKKFVVDHIDTNRCNNRVENLRWFTRLENALNNDITRSKIIFICGSIEAFIENPNILRERLDQVKEPSLEWMRTVTKEAAATAYENIKRYWAEQAKNPKPLVGGKMNDSVYSKQLNITQYVPISPNKDISAKPIDAISQQNDETQLQSLKTDLVKAKSPDIAWQKNWEQLAQFPCCPTSVGSSPLQDYYNQLILGEYCSITMFSEFDVFAERVYKISYTKANDALILLGKTYNYLRLFKIYFSDGKFIHEHIQKYESSQDNQAFDHFLSELGITAEEYRLKELFSESNLVKAKSPETAWQMKWKTPTDFLCCPDTIGNNPIEEYYNRIAIGEAYNSTNFYGSNEVQKVIDKAHTKENTIIVLSYNPNNIKHYALSKIHYFEGKFIHESLRTFFKEDGGRKYFTSEQGLEWNGEDPFDDYC